jgi:DNA ligase-1
MSFEEILSITKRTVNLHPNYKAIQFHIFDIVNRLNQMQRTILIESLRGLSPYIKVSPFWICEDLDEVTRAYDSVIKLGYEGIIVRACDAPYEVKRSTWVMKFKAKKQDDYKIVSFTEQISINGVPNNTLGALICNSGDGSTFNVGTGFTDEQRYNLWKIKESLPGMTVKVKYQHITSGNKVPRFPVFMEVVNE